MLEYLEDAIEKDPTAAFVEKEGEVVQIKTGDGWFDDIDDRATRGEDVKLEDLVSPEDYVTLKRKFKLTDAEPVKEEKPAVEQPLEEFEDKYG